MSERLYALFSHFFGAPPAPAPVVSPKPATVHTRAIHQSLLHKLDFSDTADFDDARQGYIGSCEDLIVPADDLKGGAAWNLNDYKFIDESEVAPDTVNPSLWRQARLNNIHGLFKIVDRVYQIRGMTIMEGDKGLIIIDPAICVETARRMMELYYTHRPRRDVSTIIYTHSHADHYGGVRAVTSPEEVADGKVQIIAPTGFMEHAISENVFVGNAMSHRATYMYGSNLPRGPRGQVDVGLGKTISKGRISLIAPNILIKNTTETHLVDGIETVFYLCPDSEAPSEFVMYTIRGAKVRDGNLWSRYINHALHVFAPQSDVCIAQHHWPTFGTEKILTYLEKQRDVYKFIHDQTVRQMNHGATPAEIAETLKIPRSLEREWSVRDYYGTISHNAKAQYQLYLGWYDGNPVNLNPHPPVENAKRYVQFMGGNYRFVATVTNYIVFAEPANVEARLLCADAMEQLGYQSESGPWRNAYLQGAYDLRVLTPVKPGPPRSPPAEFLGALTMPLLLDIMGLRLSAERAGGKKIIVDFQFLTTNERFVATLSNSTLTWTDEIPVSATIEADVSLFTDFPTFLLIATRQMSALYALATRKLKYRGSIGKFAELTGMMQQFPMSFAIVEPGDTPSASVEATSRGMSDPQDIPEDFEDAQFGFVGTFSDLVISSDNNPRQPTWNLRDYNFLDDNFAPETVNPSLWRQAKLNKINGLFKVCDRVYQVRGFDISNMTILEGESGLVIVDPAISIENSRKMLELYFSHRPRRPYTRSMPASIRDHFGGIKGIVNEEDVATGKVQIIAPDGFMEHAVSENVLAGNAMTRRATYMYGGLLPQSATGQVDVGLGKNTSKGRVSLIAPTVLIKNTTETHLVDGIETVFYLRIRHVPSAVAASQHGGNSDEKSPQLASHSGTALRSHIIYLYSLTRYTIRGAKVRDGNLWSRYINHALHVFAPQSDVCIAQHHWPTFGTEKILTYLEKQRDIYKFIHDQTVHRINFGETPAEIAEVLNVPQSLQQEWSVRDYYGTIRHNAKAQYQLYLGWYDGNPANLNPLPPVQNAKELVSYMGGAECVLSAAKDLFSRGDYRFTATVANHVVFADPENVEARYLCADALEQLGYQSESGPWRPCNRYGLLWDSMSIPLVLDFLGVRIRAEDYTGHSLKIDIQVPGERYIVTLQNTVLTWTNDVAIDAEVSADVVIKSEAKKIVHLLLGRQTLQSATHGGALEVRGDQAKLAELLSLLDEFPANFPIVEP
ncbi:hypothetical protein HDU93_001582 [Gonapodya sp. JEL0774]|nr:hypothetical protein HDU93_001582 [Gonapodya sp. JEL0774]